MTTQTYMELRTADFTRKLRNAIYCGRFRCLSALLHEIGRFLDADEVGLVQFAGEAKFIPLRRITVKESLIDDHAWLEILVKGVPHHVAHQNRGFSDSDFRARYIFDPNIRQEPIIIARLWPSDIWRVDKDSTFWIYVANPRLLGPPAHCPRWTSELMRLGIEWVNWKNIEFERRSNQVRAHARDANGVLQALQRTLVSPVLPWMYRDQLDELIRRMPESSRSPSADLVAKSWGAIKQLQSLVNNCSSGVSGPKCSGCSQPNVCPQKEPRQANDIELLTNLYAWRTGFWKATQKEQMPPAWSDISAAGILGLQSAVGRLRTNDRDEPIDLQNGGDRTLIRILVADVIDVLTRSSMATVESQTLGRRRLLAELARLAVTLITNRDWEPDAIRNLIRVMAGVGHEVFGVPYPIDLARHLRQTLRGESALYTLKQRYRDHFFHTIEVCLIGYTILSSFRGQESKDERQIASELWPNVDKNEFLSQWWIASLCHDTAYGIDVLGGTLQLLKYFENQPAIGDFIKEVQSSIVSLHKRIRSVAPELENDQSVEKGDHGVITASHLASALERLAPEVRQRFLPAIRAIAFHNTKFPSINASLDPVAAMLILCDTIQDWGRSQLGFERSPTVVLSRLVSHAPTPNEEQFGPVNRFSLSIECDAKSGRRQLNQGETLEIQLHYSERVRARGAIFFNWADTTHNLRRVKIDSWPFNVRISHRLPLPDGEDPKMTEFARIVLMHEAGFAQSWVDTALEGNPANAVCHSIDAGCEVVEFNLRELSKPAKNQEPWLGRELRGIAELVERAYSGDEFDSDSDPKQRAPVM